jgi:hypothetical protein
MGGVWWIEEHSEESLCHRERRRKASGDTKYRLLTKRGTQAEACAT